METQTRLPTSDISVQWTPKSAGSRYVEVDDPVGTPDDDGTYNSQAADMTTRRDVFGFTAFSVPAGSVISKVTVYYRSKRTNTAGFLHMYASIRVNGTDYNSAVEEIDSLTYYTISRNWMTNPNTGLAWTLADVNGTGPKPLQGFGYITIPVANTSGRTTQVYIEVTYLETAGAFFQLF